MLLDSAIFSANELWFKWHFLQNIESLKPIVCICYLTIRGKKKASEPLSRWAKCWPKLEPDFLVEIGKGTKIMKEFVLYPLPKYCIDFYFLLLKLPSVDMECRKSNFLSLMQSTQP